MILRKGFILFLLTIGFLSSCKQLYREYDAQLVQLQDQAIPPQFNSQQDLLHVVLLGDRHYDKWVQTCFKDSYEGRHVFIAHTDTAMLALSKGGERYFFDCALSKDIITRYNNELRSYQDIPKYYYEILIHDRQTGKTYKSPFTATDITSVLEAYIKRLNAKK